MLYLAFFTATTEKQFAQSCYSIKLPKVTGGRDLWRSGHGLQNFDGAAISM